MEIQKAAPEIIEKPSLHKRIMENPEILYASFEESSVGLIKRTNIVGEKVEAWSSWIEKPKIASEIENHFRVVSEFEEAGISIVQRIAENVAAWRHSLLKGIDEVMSLLIKEILPSIDLVSFFDKISKGEPSSDAEFVNELDHCIKSIFRMKTQRNTLSQKNKLELTEVLVGELDVIFKESISSLKQAIQTNRLIGHLRQKLTGMNWIEDIAKTEEELLASLKNNEKLEANAQMDAEMGGTLWRKEGLQEMTTALENFPSVQKILLPSQLLDCHPNKPCYIYINKFKEAVCKNVEDNKEIFKIQLDNQTSNSCVLWSPSGDKILLADRLSSHINITTVEGTKVRTLRSINKIPISCVLWLNNDEFLLGFDNGEIRAISVPTGRPTWKVYGSVCGITCMEVCGESSQFLVAGDLEGSLIVFDIEQKNMVWSHQFEEKNPETAFYGSCLTRVVSNSKNRRVATSSMSGFVRLIDIDSQTEIWNENLGSPVYQVVWGVNNDYLVATTENTMVNFIGGENGKMFHSFSAKIPNPCASLTIKPEKDVLWISNEVGEIKKFKIKRDS